MAMTFNAQRLDVAAFAQANGHLRQQVALKALRRLSVELDGTQIDRSVGANCGPIEGDVNPWSPCVDLDLSGWVKEVVGGEPQVWLRLRVGAKLPLTCQRCLEPLTHSADLDLSYRFVADERTAELQDESADEDVLALSRAFDAVSLVEDELIMALPLVPRHGQCPVPANPALATPADDAMRSPSVVAAEPGVEAKQRPFAGLRALVSPKSDSGL
jgi:uncharacterized protein